MSSNFKKDLKKEATKTSEAEVTSDVVTLPPDAGDVVYTVVTDDSVVGEVNAKLEMSYDKENWCPAVREEAGGSGTTTYSFSNQFCVDTTATPLPTGDPPVAAEDVAKNKYAVGQLSHNTSGEDVGVGDSAATRDALHHHMNKGDAFNLSWWHKSDVQPSATYNPIIFKHGGHDPHTNKKIIDLIPDGAEKKNKYLSAPANITSDTFTKCLSVPASSTTGDYIQAVNTNAAHANGILSAGGATIPTKSWTCSVWYKAPSGPTPTGDTTRFMFALNNTHGVALYTDGELKLLSPWRNLTVTMPTGIDLWDGEWHLVTWTFLADGTTSASSSFHNDAWDGTTPGDFLYIDGVQCGGQWNHSSFPPYYTSEDFILAGCESHSTYESLPGKYAHWALESGAQSPTQALARYNDGTPLDLSSTVEYYLNFEDDDTGSISSSTNLTEKGTGYDGSGTPGSDYPTAVNGTSFSITTLSDTDMKAQVDKDIFDSKLGADKSFTINKWFNSSVQPTSTDYSPVLFNNGAKATVPTVLGNTKYLDSDGDDWVSISNIWGANGSSDRIVGTDKDWTVCTWIRMNSYGQGGFFGFGEWQGHGINCYLTSNKRLAIYADNGFAHFAPTGSDFDDIADGEWHHIAVTFKSPGTSGNWYFDPIRWGYSSNGVTVYVDGVRAPHAQYHGLCTNVIDGSDATGAAMPAVFYNIDSNYTTDSYRGLVCDTASWSIFNDCKSASEVLALKNLGVGTDLSSQSGLKYYVDFQQNTSGTALSTGALSDGDTTSLANLASTGSTYTTTVQIVSGTDFSIASLATSDDAYTADVAAYDKFGNGLTASFTKKVVTVPWGNTKYYQAYQHWGNKASRILNENVATGSAPLIRYDRDWTISWWMKTSSSANAYYHTWGFQGTVSTYSTQTGTGFENEFGMSFDTGRFRFIFTNSSGTQVQKNLYWNGGEMDGGPTDDEWHFYTLTFNANGATSGDFEFQPSNALSTASNSNPDTQRSMTFYVDGQVFNNDAALTGGASQNLLGTVSDCEITSGNKEWYWVEQHHDNNNVPVGEYNQFAVYNEYMTASQVADLYDGTPGTKGGNPTNVSALSSCKVALDFNDDTYTNTDSTEFQFTNSAFSGAWASDPYPSKRDTTQAGASTQSLSSGDDTYVAMTVVNTFDATASQGTSFLLSLDGFESDADAWVSYPVGSLLDGNWHNMQITWDGSGAGSKTYDTNLKVFVDGTQLTKNASKGGSSTFTAADKHFKYTTGTFVPGTFGASGWNETGGADSKYAFQGSLDNLSLHSEATTLAKAQEFYGTDKSIQGKPSNYKTSTIIDPSKVEGWWKFEETASASTATDSSGNSINLTLNNMDTGDWVTLTDSDSIYLDTQVNGEGLTVSITRNLWKNTSTNKVEWVNSQDKDAMLVLSFNGFERDAEHWVAYKCNQTGYNINLLDGHWNNVVISYRGTTFVNAQEGGWTSDKIRFGPNSTSGDPWHINVSYNGTTLEGITPQIAVSDGASGTLTNFKGFDLSKPDADGSGNLSAGFTISDKHLKHVDTTNQIYKPHCWLASGIVESAGEDSIYAFQGKIEESSFHSGKNTSAANGDNSWWLTMSSYNSEKPKTIAGTTTASGVIASRHQPYDLLNPAEIFSSGIADITANQYINPLPYNASSNTTGGVEVYYRWGDKDGDCSSTIWDARTADDPSTSSQSFNLAVQHFNEGNKTQLDSSDTVASNTAKTMKINAVATTTGGGSGFVSVEHLNLPTEEAACVSSSINVPTLPHFRVKWTGGGTVNLGESKSKATLWYRSKK